MLFSDVCLSVAYIGPKSRTESLGKTKIGTDVAHVTRDSDTTFKVKRSKINFRSRGRGHIVAASRTACYAWARNTGWVTAATVCANVEHPWNNGLLTDRDGVRWRHTADVIEHHTRPDAVWTLRTQSQRVHLEQLRSCQRDYRRTERASDAVTAWSVVCASTQYGLRRVDCAFIGVGVDLHWCELFTIIVSSLVTPEGSKIIQIKHLKQNYATVCTSKKKR